ncbi:MAG: nicotinate (nicotinamide) nucleotide adenylyltransferase [Candidatus Binatia bacterium]|nr:nicotinate (nicotinamide) nucleotide adenylyltransferase [Candidatus Binatia bacterium]
MRRIGLYGGSFNPIHLGHLRTAIEVRAAARLEAVWMIPAHEPPHKGPEGMAPAADRLAMLQAALEGVPELRVEPIELERTGPSYSIDTLRLLRERHAGVEFALILGFDAFRELHTWHQYETMVAETDLIVTTRPPYPVSHGANPAQFGKLPIAVTQGFWYDKNIGCYAHESGHRLEFLSVTSLDISASTVRADVARGASISFLVPDSVQSYILERGLYRAAL